MTIPHGASILGLGTDLVEVDRVATSVGRTPALMSDVFTKAEREHATGPGGVPGQRWAGRWAAKEAVLKALGCGANVVALRDIEVAPSETGAPEVILHGTAAERARRIGASGVHVSISHTSTAAAATALAYALPGAQHQEPEVVGFAASLDPERDAWRGLGITPDEQAAWENAGVDSPAEAHAYLLVGVHSPDEAARYAHAGGVDAAREALSARAADAVTV